MKEHKTSLDFYVKGQMDAVYVHPLTHFKLFISDIYAAKNIHTLQNNHIAYILNTQNQQSLLPSPVIQYPLTFLKGIKNIPLQDKQDFNIKKYFEETNKFIEQGLQKGNVLVHCISGVSRSVAIVFAFLLKTIKKNPKQIFLQLRTKRLVINPNFGFIRQIKQYEKELFPERFAQQMQPSKFNHLQNQQINNKPYFKHQQKHSPKILILTNEDSYPNQSNISQQQNTWKKMNLPNQLNKQQRVGLTNHTKIISEDIKEDLANPNQINGMYKQSKVENTFSNDRKNVKLQTKVGETTFKQISPQYKFSQQTTNHSGLNSYYKSAFLFSPTYNCEQNNKRTKPIYNQLNAKYKNSFHGNKEKNYQHTIKRYPIIINSAKNKNYPQDLKNEQTNIYSLRMFNKSPDYTNTKQIKFYEAYRDKYRQNPIKSQIILQHQHKLKIPNWNTCRKNYFSKRYQEECLQNRTKYISSHQK